MPTLHDALEWNLDDYMISTDPRRLDLGVVHGFLAQSYWAQNIPLEVVRQSIAHSLNFGIYLGDRQVGFARVVTDFATFAWIGDVFIVPHHRKRGLAQWLMNVIVTHPDLEGLRRWMLATRDAQKLYEKVGFKPLAHPERFMEIRDPDVYKKA